MELALIKSEVVKTLRKKGHWLRFMLSSQMGGKLSKAGKIYHWEGDMTYEVELYGCGEDHSCQHLWN